MTTTPQLSTLDVEDRARQSGGISNAAIYRTVAELLAGRHPGGGTLVDVGCGTGQLWPFVRPQFNRYIGVDVLQYDGFPADGEFHKINLDSGQAELPAGSAEVVCGVETIEHLENPRAFVRELVRLTRPGGWIVVTTPNQLSFLSKLTLHVYGEFNAFRASSYPAHITALLEIDLRRMFTEVGLTDVAVRYTRSGRLPGTARPVPGLLSRCWPRAFSDNVAIIGRVRAS